MRLSTQFPFCVGHHVRLAQFGLPPSHSSLTFDRETDVQSFEIIFPYQIGQMKKQVEKKVWPDIYL